jgi:molybdopterin converting factor small subunit
VTILSNMLEAVNVAGHSRRYERRRSLGSGVVAQNQRETASRVSSSRPRAQSPRCGPTVSMPTEGPVYAPPMAGLRVTVRLSGPMARRLGSRRSVELEPAACVDDLVAALAREAGFEPAELRGLAVVSAGAYLPRDRLLADGDEVVVLTPVSGG